MSQALDSCVLMYMYIVVYIEGLLQRQCLVVTEMMWLSYNVIHCFRHLVIENNILCVITMK